MMEIKILNEQELQEWNCFVEEAQESSVYHLGNWGKILSDTYGYKKYYLAAIEHNNIVGGVPIFLVRSRLFGVKLISSPFCEYGGPIIDPELTEEKASQALNCLLETLKQLANNLDVERVEIRTPFSKIPENILLCHGYFRLNRYVTFHVDLKKDIDEIWASLHKTRTRKSIRKAMKSKVEAQEIDKIEQLEYYYRLYLKAMKKHGSPPHGYELFKRLYANFHPKGKMRILLAYYQGAPIGGLITFCQGKTIFDWNSVTDERYRSLNAHNLLLWNTIEWGLERGYHVFDFGRTRRGTTIYSFKKGWGGVEKPLEEYVSFLDAKRRELPDPSSGRYRLIEKFWSLMPICVITKIGPEVRAGIGF